MPPGTCSCAPPRSAFCWHLPVPRCWCSTAATFCTSGSAKVSARNYNVLLVLTIGYCVVLMQSASNVFLYVRSRHKPLAAWTLAEGIANLVLSIYWARQYGILGVALGTTVPLLIVRLGIEPFYTLHVMGIKWSEYLSKSLLRPTLVTAGVLAIGSVTGTASPRAQPADLRRHDGRAWTAFCRPVVLVRAEQRRARQPASSRPAHHAASQDAERVAAFNNQQPQLS